MTSDLKKNPVHLIKLKNMMKELTCALEDNEIQIILYVGVVVEIEN